MKKLNDATVNKIPTVFPQHVENLYKLFVIGMFQWQQSGYDLLAIWNETIAWTPSLTRKTA